MINSFCIYVSKVSLEPCRRPPYIVDIEDVIFCIREVFVRYFLCIVRLIQHAYQERRRAVESNDENQPIKFEC